MSMPDTRVEIGSDRVYLKRFLGRDACAGLEQMPIGEGLHSDDRDALLDAHRHDLFGETLPVRVHDVERHHDAVPRETLAQHALVDARVTCVR